MLFISSHQYPYYPGTGGLKEIGQGVARGTVVNLPLSPGVGDEGFQRLYGEVVFPLIRRFQPQLILVSAGFDAYARDPLAQETLEAVLSVNSKNFMVLGKNEQAVRAIPGGFQLWGGGTKERPWEAGAFSATVSDPEAKVNLTSFRGGWWDALTIAWKDIVEAACFDRAA